MRSEVCAHGWNQRGEYRTENVGAVLRSITQCLAASNYARVRGGGTCWPVGLTARRKELVRPAWRDNSLLNSSQSAGPMVGPHDRPVALAEQKLDHEEATDEMMRNSRI